MSILLSCNVLDIKVTDLGSAFSSFVFKSNCFQSSSLLSAQYNVSSRRINHLNTPLLSAMG